MKKKTFKILHSVDGYNLARSNMVIVYAHTKYVPIHQKYKALGALESVRVGLSGKTYAIPFWNDEGKKLDIEDIRMHVNDLYDFACRNNWVTFCVGNIGIGVYGFLYEEVVPLFLNCMYLPNFNFTKTFLLEAKRFRDK